MEEAHAAGCSLDLGDRIPPADGCPVDVELDLHLRRQLSQEDVPDRRAIERLELEGVVVIAEPDPVVRQWLGEPAELRGKSLDIGDRPSVALRHPRHDHAWARDFGQARCDGARILTQRLDRLVRGDSSQFRHFEQPSKFARHGWG